MTTRKLTPRHEIWEGKERIIVVEGGPIGYTLNEREANVICNWLSVALGELLKRYEDQEITKLREDLQDERQTASVLADENRKLRKVVEAAMWLVAEVDYRDPAEDIHKLRQALKEYDNG